MAKKKTNVVRQRKFCESSKRCSRLEVVKEYARVFALYKKGLTPDDYEGGSLRDYIAERFHVTGATLEKWLPVLKLPVAVQLGFERNCVQVGWLSFLVKWDKKDLRRLADRIHKLDLCYPGTKKVVAALYKEINEKYDIDLKPGLTVKEVGDLMRLLRKCRATSRASANRLRKGYKADGIFGFSVGFFDRLHTWALKTAGK